jgi:hypothetical protein
MHSGLFPEVMIRDPKDYYLIEVEYVRRKYSAAGSGSRGTRGRRVH